MSHTYQQYKLIFGSKNPISLAFAGQYYEGTAATGCSKTFDTKMKRKLGSPNYEDLFL